MKTFKQFQEGIFDWLPRGNYETHSQAKKRAINIDPKSVRTWDDGIKRDMPQWGDHDNTSKDSYKDPNKPATTTRPREKWHGPTRRPLSQVLPQGGLET